MIFILLILSQLNVIEAGNETSNSLLEPQEYYLIILGILSGTLIFLFLAFTLFYLNNNKKFKELQRRMSDYHTSRNYLYQTNYDLSPYRQPTFINRQTQYSTRSNPLFDEEENISTSSFTGGIENEPEKLDNNNQVYYKDDSKSMDNRLKDSKLMDSKLMDSKLMDNISVSSDEVFEGFNEIKNILEQTFTPKLEKKDEYIEVKPKKNSLKKKHSNSSITNTKHNLLDELRKELPKLVPRNMLD